MSDKFFTQSNCDRCEKCLKNGRMMSMFNTDCLCLDCIIAERQRPDHRKAVEADNAEIRKGNYNFKGSSAK